MFSLVVANNRRKKSAHRASAIRGVEKSVLAITSLVYQIPKQVSTKTDTDIKSSQIAAGLETL